MTATGAGAAGGDGSGDDGGRRPDDRPDGREPTDEDSTERDSTERDSTERDSTAGATRADVDALLACVRGADLPDDADRTQVRRLAHLHGVAPVVERRLGTDGVGVTGGDGLNAAAPDESDGPSAVADRADDRTRSWAFRSLQYVDLLHRLVDAFADAGVDALPYKGPVLAAELYDGPAGRYYGDLDFFVPRESLPAAAAVLQRHGFDPVDHDQSIVRVAAGETAVRPRREFTFVDDRDRTVELRWRLGSAGRPLRVPFDEAWEARREVTVAGRPVPTLGETHLTLVLARHAAKHGWVRLSWSLDLARHLDRLDEGAWHRVLSRASALRCRRVVLASVGVAVELLDANVPEWVGDAVEGDDEVRAVVDEAVRTLFEEAETAPLEEEMSIGWRVDARLADHQLDRARWWLSELFVPRRSDAAAVSLPRWAAPAYYLIRPIRLLGTREGPSLGQVWRWVRG